MTTELIFAKVGPQERLGTGETGPNGGVPAGAFDDRRHPVRQRCHADARSTLSCTSMRSVRVGSWRCALHNSGLLSPITAFALCTATRVRGKGLCRGRYVMRFHKEPSRDTTFKHTVRRSGFESFRTRSRMYDVSKAVHDAPIVLRRHQRELELQRQQWYQCHQQ